MNFGQVKKTCRESRRVDAIQQVFSDYKSGKTSFSSRCIAKKTKACESDRDPFATLDITVSWSHRSIAV